MLSLGVHPATVSMQKSQCSYCSHACKVFQEIWKGNIPCTCIASMCQLAPECRPCLVACPKAHRYAALHAASFQDLIAIQNVSSAAQCSGHGARALSAFALCVLYRRMLMLSDHRLLVGPPCISTAACGDPFLAHRSLAAQTPCANTRRFPAVLALPWRSSKRAACRPAVCG